MASADMCNMLRQHFGAAAILFLFFLFALFSAAPCFAQGALGIGARMTMVRGDMSADPSAGAARFLGGQLRARLSQHTAIEVSLDRRSQNNADLTQRVLDYPLQGSVLLFPLHTTIAPYVLGGVGWYTHIVDTMAAGKATATSTTRKMGYHAGLGGEVKIGKHTGIHADYRYTFVHFGDGTTSGTGGLASRFMPSYDGSMWTAGVTFYF